MISVSAADICLPSIVPPAGLPVDSVPQFICFGFDDNGFANGLAWVDSLFLTKENPDGTPVRATFYMVSDPEKGDTALWNTVSTLQSRGYEIGNHTRHHTGNLSPTDLSSPKYWNGEICGCDTDMLKQYGT